MEDNKTQERFRPEWKKAVLDRLNQTGMTQEKIAEVIGVSQGRVNKILNTPSMFFTLSQLASLADMMHISIDTLIGRNDSGYAHENLDSILSFFIGLDDIMPIHAEVRGGTTHMSIDSSSTLGKALEEYISIKHNPNIPEDVKMLALDAWTQKKMKEFREIRSTQDKDDSNFRYGFEHPDII